MNDLVAEVLPLALAIALSPFPIIPAILLLFTPKARANSLSFLAGWFVGIAVATGLFIFLASVIELLDEPPTWASWTRIVIGLALVGLGLQKWLKRKENTESPAWMRSIASVNAVGAARLALVLSLANPKILLLAAAAGLSIGTYELAVAQNVLVAVIFTVVAASTVAIPVLLFLVLGDRILGPLGKVRSWLEKHNAAVMAIVFILIGAKLLSEGISGL